ncbi:MAG TPA: VIT domain-containing protein, partial [Verrucomicrobiae bacterium]|nr:VIT domain-containing protein [Verrucomicrobiae bacterium]
MKISTGLLVIGLVLAPRPSPAQVKEHRLGMSMPHFIMPQTRPLALANSGSVQITAVNVSVEVIEQVATTTMDILLTNTSAQRLQAEMIMPVPDQAGLRGFDFQGASHEPSAQLLPKEEARRLYDYIVARTKDPALLEFIGYNLIRSSVFPVEPYRGQRVRLIYEHLLPAEGARVDYVLPRTESVEYRVPWKISVNIKSKAPIATVYSPSHKLETTRANDHRLTARLAADAATEPGSFRLSYLRQSDAITASLLAYPDPQIGGGYFLLLAGAPAPARAPTAQAQKREVILVLDRSGSMAGEKLEQVRAAALQVLEGLEEGEAFNI